MARDLDDQVRQFRTRRLDGPYTFVTSDAHQGLVASSQRRCPAQPGNPADTRSTANLMSVTSKASWPWVKTLLHSIYDQPDTVHAQFDRVFDALTDTVPAVVDHLEDARADILAFASFPKEIWRQIWFNNRNERLNREIRRRTDVVGTFPDRDAIISLIGAVLAEQRDEWAEGRRYLGLDVLDRAREPKINNDTQEHQTTDLAIAARPAREGSEPVHHPTGLKLFSSRAGNSLSFKPHP